MPATYRFTSKKVYMQQKLEMGNVTLSHKPTTWDSFSLALQNAQTPDDFLDIKERNQTSQNRDPFKNSTKEL